MAAGAADDDEHDDAAFLDATQADFDLYSGEAELPEVAYFDQTLGHQELGLDETRNDESFDETMFVRAIAEHETAEPDIAEHDIAEHDIAEHDTADVDVTARKQTDQARHTPSSEAVAQDGSADSVSPAVSLDASVSYITDESSEAPLTFVYDESGDHNYMAGADGPVDHGTVAQRNTRGHQEKRPSIEDFPARKRTPAKAGFWRRLLRSWLVRFLVVLIVLASALSLYAYRDREALLQSQQLRPVLDGICLVLGCKLPALVDLDALKLVKRSVFSHPSIDNALVIDLGFINEAEFDQPYPLLEIRLTDNRGGIVKQNNVAPSEYLQQWQPESVLTAGERIDLSLTVEDPGQTATSFELKFR